MELLFECYMLQVHDDILKQRVCITLMTGAGEEKVGRELGKIGKYFLTSF